jgi:hypothetical protein
MLDAHAAEAITISELDELAVVGGIGRVDEFGNSRYGPLQWLLRKPDVDLMLDEAYRRRKEAQVERTSGGILRRLTS